MATRDPNDIQDRETGKVRVCSGKCSTCVFHPGNRMYLPAGRLKEIVDHNLAAGALLTCHQTLPYGDHPDFGPAVCAGFWETYGHETVAGQLAERLTGITRVDPPKTVQDDKDAR